MTDAMVWVLIIGLIVLIAAMVYDMCFRCVHEWEEVVRNSVSVVYRCKKCGKEKRYRL